MSMRFKALPGAFVDRVVLGGWIAILLTGQCLLNRNVLLLEWGAVVWLSVGMLLVRRSACLPLLLLTCPAYMSEIQRDFAWSQVMIAGILLIRVFFDGSLNHRQQRVVLGVAAVVILFSWPREWAGLFAEISTFPKRAWPGHFLHAHATWAIYPFRQAFDRTLIVSLVAALFLSGRYFSTPRLWRAYAHCGLLMIVSTFCAALLPWQEPHRFLGTTNYPAHNNYLFHGAGYNPYFMTMPVVTMIPLLLVPLRARRAWIYPGLIGLAIPILFISQRAVGLGLAMVLLVALLLSITGLITRKGRQKLAIRLAWSLRHAFGIAAVFAVSVAVSIAWIYAMNAITPAGIQKAMRSVSVLTRMMGLKEPQKIPDTVSVPDKPAEKEKKKKPPELESTGRDIWMGRPEIVQGTVLFRPESMAWAALPRGVAITLADQAAMTNDQGGVVVSGTSVPDDLSAKPWIHVSLPDELSSDQPLVTTDHNAPSPFGGGLLVRNVDYHIQLIAPDGRTSGPPVNVYMSPGEVMSLEWSGEGAVTQENYQDVKESTLGAWQNRLGRDVSGQGGAHHAVLISEVNAGQIVKPSERLITDMRLGATRDNGGSWIELVVLGDGVDLRGWEVRWAYARYNEPETKLGEWSKFLKKQDKARRHFWRTGLATFRENFFRGAGTGTYARYHREHSSMMYWTRLRDGRLVHQRLGAPHMHNTYLDLMFEHGFLPMGLIYLSAFFAGARIIMRGGVPSRFWLFPLASVGSMAAVQNFFYAFTSQLFFVPLLVVLLHALTKKRAAR